MRKSAPKSKPASGKAAKPLPDGACKRCGQVHRSCTGHRQRKSKDQPLVPCGAKAMTTSRTRKCKNHGGKSLKGEDHPNYKNGEHVIRQKYQYLPDPLAKRVEEMAGDAIDNLEENVRILRALESRYHERFGTGESPDAWKAVKEIVAATNPYNMVSAAFCNYRLKLIAEGALGEMSLERRIEELQERQRKMTETLTRSRKDIQETYTHEEFVAIMNTIVTIIKNNVHDRPTLTRIETAILRAADGEEQERHSLTVYRPRG